mgnify:FL=1
MDSPFIPPIVQYAKYQIMDLASLIGILSSTLFRHCHSSLSPAPALDDIIQRDVLLQITIILKAILRMSTGLSINLIEIIQNKMAFNERKYPVSLCANKEVKYTAFSDKTGITTTTASITSLVTSRTPPTTSHFLAALPNLLLSILSFSSTRGFGRSNCYSYTPTNLVLAIISELGELANILQWEQDNKSLSITDINILSHEMADISIYLLRLAYSLDFDILLTLFSEPNITSF